MTLSKTRGSVRTESSRDHILIIIRIHHTTHPRDETALPVIIANEVSLTSCLVECIVLEIVCRNLLCRTATLFIGSLLCRVHTYKVDVMLSKRAVVVDKVLNSPVTSLVLIYRTAVDGIGILVVNTSTSERA